MAVKGFLAKLLLGRDINGDLAMAEKENREVQGKYNNVTRGQFTVTLLQKDARCSCLSSTEEAT